MKYNKVAIVARLVSNAFASPVEYPGHDCCTFYNEIDYQGKSITECFDDDNPYFSPKQEIEGKAD